MNATTTAAEIAAFNTLTQATFHHEPRSPEIDPQYPAQRYFCRGAPSYGTDVGEAPDSDSPHKLRAHVRTTVYRNARDDTAELALRVACQVGDSTTYANLTAPELRDLAARLVDAAHDLELWPAARLAAYANLCDKAAA